MDEVMHAVMAVDPGGTTGVAAAFVRPRATVKETLLDIPVRKSVEVKGDWLSQAREIAGLMNDFVYNAHEVAEIPLARIHFVFEDFVLRMPARTTNLTSVWVMAATVGIANGLLSSGVKLAYQQPSVGKGYATNPRLKLWGLYVVGSEHERDAWRHVAYRVANEIAGG